MPIQAKAYDKLHKEWRPVTEIRWNLAGQIEEVTLDTYCFLEDDLKYLDVQLEDTKGSFLFFESLAPEAQ